MLGRPPCRFRLDAPDRSVSIIGRKIEKVLLTFTWLFRKMLPRFLFDAATHRRSESGSFTHFRCRLKGIGYAGILATFHY